MGVTATFDYEPTDHYRAARAVTRQTPARYLSWVFGALSVGMLAWTVLPLWRDGASGAALWIGLLIVNVFWLTFIPLAQHRAARKLPARDPSVRGPQTRTVDETGYHSRGNGVALDLPWHAMARAVETTQFFLLFVDKQCAYYLPKRVLSAGEAAEVRALVARTLSDRARVLDA